MSAIDAADIAGPDGDVDALLACLGKAARAAGTALGGASTEAKNTALLAAAAEIAPTPEIFSKPTPPT